MGFAGLKHCAGHLCGRVLDRGFGGCHFRILNVTIGALLKLLTLPLSIVTFGFFFLVVNALMFWAASFIKGFHVAGFWAAFFGGLIVTIVSMLGQAPG